MNWDVIMVAAAFVGGSGVAGFSARYVLSETRKTIADLKLDIAEDRETLKLNIVKDREIFLEKLNGKYINRELCEEKHKRTTERVDAVEKVASAVCCPLGNDPILGAWLKAWMETSIEERHRRHKAEVTD